MGMHGLLLLKYLLQFMISFQKNFFWGGGGRLTAPLLDYRHPAAEGGGGDLNAQPLLHENEK